MEFDSHIKCWRSSIYLYLLCNKLKSFGACVESALSVWATLDLPPLMACVHCQDPGCFAGELSKAGPGLCALPRSKPLRFRFLGTPQRHRLSWAYILCPSLVRAAQATRCLVSTHSPGGRCILLPPPPQLLSFLDVLQESQVCHVSPLGS